MRVLFDQGTPLPLRRYLRPHQVDSAAELGWSELENGELLQQAESIGYDALITTDQQLRYQQNLSRRKVRVLVLMTTSWPRIQPKAGEVRAALEGLGEGQYAEIAF
jgi:hypothetical protein